MSPRSERINLSSCHAIAHAGKQWVILSPTDDSLMERCVRLTRDMVENVLRESQKMSWNHHDLTIACTHCLTKPVKGICTECAGVQVQLTNASQKLTGPAKINDSTYRLGCGGRRNRRRRRRYMYPRKLCVKISGIGSAMRVYKSQCQVRPNTNRASLKRVHLALYDEDLWFLERAVNMFKSQDKPVLEAKCPCIAAILQQANGDSAQKNVKETGGGSSKNHGGS